MNPITFETTIQTDFGQLEETGDAVHGFLASNAVSSDVSYKVELALEEMVTNIIKYGYNEPSPANTVRITVIIYPDKILMDLEDFGHEFNPLLAEKPDTSMDLASRSIGGVGIHLTRNMTSSMEYFRDGGKNLLKITVDRGQRGRK